MTRLERWTGQSNGIARQEAKAMIGVSVVKDCFAGHRSKRRCRRYVAGMSDLVLSPARTIPPMVMPFDPTASIPLF